MTNKTTKFDALFKKSADLQPIPIAVICPESAVALGGAILAYEQKSIVPILIGDKNKIHQTAAEIGKDVSSFRLIDVPETEAVSQTIKLIHAGEAQAVMKGSLHSDDFMRLMVSRESNLRTTRRMSHCMVVDVPTYKKLFIITDAALNIFPGVKERKDIIQNAIDLALSLGISTPKVALLSAVETLNPHIPTTSESIELCKLAANGEIKGGIVEGPLSLDLAVSEKSVKTKKIQSQVAGNADILVVPNIEVGNVLTKSLDCFADALTLGITLGAKIPIILTSRAADANARAGSCMLAKFIKYGQTT